MAAANKAVWATQRGDTTSGGDIDSTRVDATLLAVESQHMRWDRVLRGRDSPVSVRSHRQLSSSSSAG